MQHGEVYQNTAKKTKSLFKDANTEKKIKEKGRKERKKDRHTHSGEVVSSARFPSVLAAKQHVLQLVSQPVHELQAGSFKAPGR